MVYEIIPARMELFLASILGRLSNEEKAVYKSLNKLEDVLENHANLEELRDCRTQRLPEVYCVYALIENNERKPYLHKRYHNIVKKFDERIKTLEEKMDMQRRYVAQN